MPNLNLKNFAKIKDSDFDVKDITVFAGKPGTGKSYIMKMLYAISEMYYKKSNNLLVHEATKDSFTLLNILVNISIKDNEVKSKAKSFLDKKDFKNYKKTVNSFIDSGLKNNINNVIKEIEEINSTSVDTQVEFFVSNIIKSIFSSYEQISNNFVVNYDNLKISLKETNLIVTDNSKVFHQFNEVLFVETPLILEFKKFMNRENGKTPYHIESLLKILDKDYSFTDNEQDEFIKSFVKKSREIIKGNIEDSGDSFVFKTDDKNYDIVNASSGIKSIGLLQYLVTNKALKKGSVLFWEEPEVHLHPTWQLKMIDLFVELMNAGVKIVFSTHSPFMADYLNAKSTREKFSDRISFNLLSEEEGIVSNTILNDENWNLLQSELLDPLEEIMWEYL